jgi:hypothetical protein
VWTWLYKVVWKSLDWYWMDIGWILDGYWLAEKVLKLNLPVIGSGRWRRGTSWLLPGKRPRYEPTNLPIKYNAL